MSSSGQWKVLFLRNGFLNLVRLAFVGHFEGTGSRYGWELSVWATGCVELVFAESLNKSLARRESSCSQLPSSVSSYVNARFYLVNIVFHQIFVQKSLSQRDPSLTILKLNNFLVSPRPPHLSLTSHVAVITS